MAEYDLTLEVPAPKETLDRMNALVNELAKRAFSDDMRRPSGDEETDLLITLFGLGRLVELNVRAAWEMYAINEKTKETSTPRLYGHVLKNMKVHFTGEPLHFLLRTAMLITDGLVHGNYFQAFSIAKTAYERDDLGLTQDGFHYQTIVTTTFTSEGFVVDAKTGVATTSSGKPIPHKSYVPSREKTYDENFVAFFVSGSFAFVYDVLLEAFSRSYHLRKCIAAATS